MVDVRVVCGLGSIADKAADNCVHVLCSHSLPLGKYLQVELLTRRVGVELGESARPLFEGVAVLVTF